MSEEKTDTRPSLSDELFDIAVKTNLTTAANRAGFDAFEKGMISHVYLRLGLKDVPEKYQTFNQFIDAFASTLMANVQKDVENLNLKRRLAVIGLANTIQEKDTKGTAEKVADAAADADPEKK